MSQPNLNVEGFVAFLETKDPTEEINQLYWTSCAVGSYIKSTGWEHKSTPELINVFRDFANTLPAPVCGRVMCGAINANRYKTYGELLNELKKAMQS